VSFFETKQRETRNRNAKNFSIVKAAFFVQKIKITNAGHAMHRTVRLLGAGQGHNGVM